MNIKEIYERFNRLKDEHLVAILEGADDETVDDIELELSYLEDQINLYHYEKHNIDLWARNVEMGV